MPADVVLRTLRHVWDGLEAANLPRAVMGGLALAAWKHVRATHDVDLLVGIGDTDPAELIRALADQAIRPKRQPPLLIVGHLRLIQLLYEPPGSFLELQIDLVLADSDYQREALARRIQTRLPDMAIEVAVLSCEDLILHKLLAGRIIDRADCVALLRANRGSLDWAYLGRWSEQLAQTRELREVYDEAFPDGPPLARIP